MRDSPSRVLREREEEGSGRAGDARRRGVCVCVRVKGYFAQRETPKRAQCVCVCGGARSRGSSGWRSEARANAHLLSRDSETEETEERTGIPK